MTERKSTLGATAGRQSIVTEDLRKALAEFGPDQNIIEYVNMTPWGNYLMGWELV